MVCGLPPHGASAVLCDACTATYEDQPEPSAVEDALQWVCRGYPGSDGRMPIAELRGEHGHDRSKHQEATQARPMHILPEDRRFPSHVEEGQGCHCSRCGHTIWDGVVALRVFPESGEWQYRYHPTCFGAMPLEEDPYTDADGWNAIDEPPGEWDADADHTGGLEGTGEIDR